MNIHCKSQCSESNRVIHKNAHYCCWNASILTATNRFWVLYFPRLFGVPKLKVFSPDVILICPENTKETYWSIETSLSWSLFSHSRVWVEQYMNSRLRFPARVVYAAGSRWVRTWSVCLSVSLSAKGAEKSTPSCIFWKILFFPFSIKALDISSRFFHK